MPPPPASQTRPRMPRGLGADAGEAVDSGNGMRRRTWEARAEGRNWMGGGWKTMGLITLNHNISIQNYILVLFFVRLFVPPVRYSARRHYAPKITLREIAV